MATAVIPGPRAVTPLTMGALRMERKVLGNTIDTYCSSVCKMVNEVSARLTSGRCPVESVPQSVRDVIDGFKKCDAPLDKRVKLSLGFVHFMGIRPLADLRDRENRLLMMMLEIAISHLLRLSELCPDTATGKRHAPGRLERQCFVFLPSFADPQTLVIDPKLQKTDRYGHGKPTGSGRTGLDEVNPPVHLRQWILDYPCEQDQVLFAWPEQDGDGVWRTGDSPVTLAQFRRWVKYLLEKAGFNPQDFDGLSTRRGGMKAATKAGLPDWLQKVLGRWRSNAYKRYRPAQLRKISLFTEQLFRASFKTDSSMSAIPSPEEVSYTLPDPNR